MIVDWPTPLVCWTPSGGLDQISPICLSRCSWTCMQSRVKVGSLTQFSSACILTTSSVRVACFWVAFFIKGNVMTKFNTYGDLHSRQIKDFLQRRSIQEKNALVAKPACSLCWEARSMEAVGIRRCKGKLQGRLIGRRLIPWTRISRWSPQC